MKFWHGNKLAAEAEYDPAKVAELFIAAARGGYDLDVRPSIEFAYRWWLTDPEGFDATWDSADDGELFAALDRTLTADDRDFLWGRLMEGIPE